MKVSITEKFHFNSAHRLHNDEWDDIKNIQVFGSCSLPNYHGHNYNLEVTIEGDLNSSNGIIINHKGLNKIVRENIIEYLDYKNLNIEIPEFASKNPTSENVAIEIWNILRSKIDLKYTLKIKLYETERNIVFYKG